MLSLHLCLSRLALPVFDHFDTLGIHAIALCQALTYRMPMLRKVAQHEFVLSNFLLFLFKFYAARELIFYQSAGVQSFVDRSMNWIFILTLFDHLLRLRIDRRNFLDALDLRVI